MGYHRLALEARRPVVAEPVPPVAAVDVAPNIRQRNMVVQHQERMEANHHQRKARQVGREAHRLTLEARRPVVAEPVPPVAAVAVAPNIRQRNMVVQHQERMEANHHQRKTRQVGREAHSLALEARRPAVAEPVPPVAAVAAAPNVCQQERAVQNQERMEARQVERYFRRLVLKAIVQKLGKLLCADISLHW